MQLVTDLSALMRWTLPIMVFSSNQQMTQGSMRCYLMLMVRSIRSRCSTKPELVVLVHLKTQAKEVTKIRHKWGTRCIMATSWKTSDKVMLDNKMWTISKLSSIMEDSLLTKLIIRILLIRVTEMEQALLASTQAVSEATESEQPTVLPKIIKPICSTSSIRGKHQMATRISNKWWWRPSNSSTPLQTTTRWSQVWTPLDRALTTLTHT